MNVRIRTKRGRDGATQRRRRRERDLDARPPAGHERHGGGAVKPVSAERTTPPAPDRVIPPPPQDRALYTCSCGFVFSHDVSTSVACPHCGDMQAW